MRDEGLSAVLGEGYRARLAGQAHREEAAARAELEAFEVVAKAGGDEERLTVGRHGERDGLRLGVDRRAEAERSVGAPRGLEDRNQAFVAEGHVEAPVRADDHLRGRAL